MAKLYWRVKKDGKWTWKPAKVQVQWNEEFQKEMIEVQLLEEEE